MKKAFTLAEVLITLSVIAVIALMTIPNLIKNHQNRVCTAQLQRFNNSLRNAAQNYLSDVDTESLNGSNFNNDLKSFMTNYLGAKIFCDDYKDCFSDSYTNTKGEADNEIVRVLADNCGSNGHCAILESGTTILMTPMSSDFPASKCIKKDEQGSCTSSERVMWHGSSEIVLDVNGKSGPNVAGRDIFDFFLYTDGTIGHSYLVADDKTRNLMMACPEASAYESHCFDKIKAAGWVMDY